MKTLITKIFSFSLALIMALVLSACGSGETVLGDATLTIPQYESAEWIPSRSSEPQRDNILPLAYTASQNDVRFLNAQNGDYFDINRIDVKTIVILIDSDGAGEEYLRAEWEKLRDMYWQLGENLIVEDDDWMYYSEIPFGLFSPLDPTRPVSQIREFIIEYFTKLGGEFRWKRVFIYQDRLRLEPRDFGPYMTHGSIKPDALLRAGGNPFGKSFIVNGFNTRKAGNETGLHGEGHLAESMSANTAGEAALIESTTLLNGSTHCVLEPYLNLIGVAPNEQRRITTGWFQDTEVKAYDYRILTAAQQDTYNVYIQRKIREHFNLLYYYERFFSHGWADEASTISAPEKPSSWAEPQINRAITMNLVPASLQSKYTEPITRAEFCALVVALYETAKGEPITGRTTFSDTNDVNVQKAAAIGVVSGTNTERRLFSPDNTLTREMATVMLARLADALGKPLPVHESAATDKSSFSSWAVGAIGQIQAAGIMSSTSDTANVFSPQSPYTREQSIVTILRLFDFVK